MAKKTVEKEKPAGEGGRKRESVILEVQVTTEALNEKTTLVLTEKEYARFDGLFDVFRASL